MTNKNFKKPVVAIVGTGNIGKALAENLVKGGRQLIISGRNLADAEKLAAKLGDKTTALDLPATVREADILVLAIWFDAVKEFIAQYAGSLAGKVIVDPSNPIAPDGNGGFKKIIPADQSAGLIIDSLLPESSTLVKSLGTLGASSLSASAFQIPEKAVMFYAIDNDEVRAAIEELIVDSGFAPWHIGGINQSARIEVFGDLHEYGALGKTVTVSEVKNVLPELTQSKVA